MGLFRKFGKEIEGTYYPHYLEPDRAAEILQEARRVVAEQEPDRLKEQLRQKDRKIRRLRILASVSCVVMCFAVLSSLPPVRAFASRVWLEITGGTGNTAEISFTLDLPVLERHLDDESDIASARYDFNGQSVLYQEIPVSQSDNFTFADTEGITFHYPLGELTAHCHIDPDGGIAVFNYDGAKTICITVQGEISKEELIHILSELNRK